MQTMDEDDISLEYDFDEALVTGPGPEPEARGDDRRIYAVILVVLAFAGGFAAGSYMQLEKLSVSEDRAFVCENALGAQEYLVAQSRTEEALESLLRKQEMNLTAECWNKLEICHDQNYELLGLNITESKLKKERDELIRELEKIGGTAEKWKTKLKE